MDLKCLVYPGWQPRIRVASVRREWMDAAPESFAYRCLPLGIANSHGWEILSPCGFVAEWNGGPAPDDVVIRPDDGADPREAPQAMFGLGVFTFHVHGLFKTSPGWNLHVSGPPNMFKDGAAPLTGLIETDWSPYTFTMNWKLTRPGYSVRFEEGEPIAHFFPIERGLIEQIRPELVPIHEEPETKELFEQWSASRDAFQQEMRDNPPDRPSDKWQKMYYRGLLPTGECPVADHKVKLQIREFVPKGGPLNFAPEGYSPAPDPVPAAASLASRPPAAVPPATEPERNDAMAIKLAKYEWVLEMQERQRRLSSKANAICRVEGLSSQDFLDDYYAPSRPVVIAGELADWPASSLWTPEYLKQRIGSTPIEFQSKRSTSPDFERYKDNHKSQIPFDLFIDMITAEEGNDAYVTAYNAATNREALRPLDSDMRPLNKFLAQTPEEPGGLLWIGPAGTMTSMHHDLTNNLIVQVVGSKRIMMAAATESPKMYNDRHVFSEVANVLTVGERLNDYPKMADVNFHEVILGQGDALFIPIGWWHQVESLSFSVTLTFTNFLWNNDGWQTYPMNE